MAGANEDHRYKNWARKFLTHCADWLSRHKFLGAGAVLLVCVVFFLAGTWYGNGRTGGKSGPGGRKILHYVDPMNPAHTSPEPGMAPCGMKLEPVYADAEGNAPDPTLPPGAVKVTPQKQQLIGVRLSPVEKSSYTLTLRALGKVAVDETRVYRLNAAIDGWIRETFNNTTGMVVKKNEPLATFYSPEFLSAQQSLIYAMGAQDQYNATAAQEPPTQRYFTRRNLKQAENTLLNLGMTEVQIQEIERARTFAENITISAPATSFIIARNISKGQRFEKGFEWYRLADLSRVWVLADLYESEAQHIRPGDKVKVTYPYQKKTFQATVSEVPPIFDPVSRTLKVRLEVDNPTYLLRPDMFVDVEFPIKLPSAVNVPVDAVLDSGLKKTVFVAREDGYFEPRQVETGWRLGNRVEITKGLNPDERIVVSGNFLIDSESRMKLAAAGMYGEVSRDPICGMYVEAGKSGAKGLKAEFQGHPYYFCSENCKRQFDAEPSRYLAKSDRDQGGCDHASAGGETRPAAESARGTEVNDRQSPGAAASAPAKSDAALNAEAGAGNLAKSASPGQTQPGIAPPGSAPGAMVPDMPLIADKLPDMPKNGGTGPGMQVGGAGMPVMPLGSGQPMAAVPPSGKTPGVLSDQDIPRDIRGRPLVRALIKKEGEVAAATGPAGTATKPPAAASSLNSQARSMRPKDPVCGMVLDGAQIKDTTWKSEFHGETYYFCSQQCKQEFDKEPERYLAGKEGGVGAVQPTRSPPANQPGAGGQLHD